MAVFHKKLALHFFKEPGNFSRRGNSNPIEKLWSKVKAWLRRVGAKTFDTVAGAIGDALRAVAAEECLNYFRSCGYVS